MQFNALNTYSTFARLSKTYLLSTGYYNKVSSKKIIIYGAIENKKCRSVK